MEPNGRSFGTKSIFLATILGLAFIAFKLFFGGPSESIGHTNFSRSVGVRKAVAVMSGATPATGNVTFEQPTSGGEVKISGKIKGLSPNALHGFHVHQYGNLTGGCDSAGPHFDLYGNKHGAPTAKIRHVGDLGNIKTDASGEADFALTDKVMSLEGPKNIIGRAIVVHVGQDDLGLGGTPESLINGNSGPRAACGVIGIA